MVLIDFRLVCEKLIIFPYAECIVEFCEGLVCYDIVRFMIEVGVDAKCRPMPKNVTLNTRELPAVAGQRQLSRRQPYSMT